MLIISSNPCFDATFWVTDLVPGSVLRSSKNTYLPGGKGINVARVRKTLDAKKTRIAIMLPNLEGALFKDLLAKENHNVSYLDIEGTVRKAILINEENSLQNTVIVGKSTVIKSSDWSNFCRLAETLIRKGEIVAVMGSLPIGTPENGLEELTNIIHKVGGQILADTSPASIKTRGSAILDFISPNLDEAEALISNTSESVYLVDDSNIKERAMDAALKLQGLVSKTVIITSGKFGVALKTEKLHKWIDAFTLPEDNFKSSVGAGDSFVAGFTFYLDEHPDQIERAIEFGMACGAAQCETFEPGNLIKERALEIFNEGQA